MGQGRVDGSGRTRVEYVADGRVYADEDPPPIAEVGCGHQDDHTTSAAAWTACLILMSLTEVLGRTALLGTRGHCVRQTQRTLVPAP